MFSPEGNSLAESVGAISISFEVEEGLFFLMSVGKIDGLC